MLQERYVCSRCLQACRDDIENITPHEHYNYRYMQLLAGFMLRMRGMMEFLDVKEAKLV